MNNRETDRSQFRRRIEDLARALGKDPDDFLDRYRESVRAAGSPRGECLEPYEIEEYVNGISLPQARLDHLPECSSCRALLEAARPSEDLKQKFLEAMRAERAVYPGPAVEAAPSARPGPIPELIPPEVVPVEVGPSMGEFVSVAGSQWDESEPPRVTATIVREAIADGLSVIVPVTLTLSALSAYFIWGEGALRLRTWVAPILCFAVLAFATLILVKLGAMLVGSRRYLQHSPGAIFAGVLLSVGLGWLAWGQFGKKQDLSIALAQESLERVAIASLSAWRNDGEFPTYVRETPGLRLGTETAVPGYAVYWARADGLPGGLRLEMHADSGNLWWMQDPESKTLRSRVVAGIVTALAERAVILENDAGRELKIELGAGGTPPKPGTRLMAVLRPDSDTATFWISQAKM